MCNQFLKFGFLLYNFIMEKNERKFWFVNISEYHHQTMGLISSDKRRKKNRKIQPKFILENFNTISLLVWKIYKARCFM